MTVIEGKTEKIQADRHVQSFVRKVGASRSRKQTIKRGTPSRMPHLRTCFGLKKKKD